jgi:hypothetical protein
VVREDFFFEELYNNASESVDGLPGDALAGPRLRQGGDRGAYRLAVAAGAGALVPGAGDHVGHLGRLEAGHEQATIRWAPPLIAARLGPVAILEEVPRGPPAAYPYCGSTRSLVDSGRTTRRSPSFAGASSSSRAGRRRRRRPLKPGSGPSRPAYRRAGTRSVGLRAQPEARLPFARERRPNHRLAASSALLPLLQLNFSSGPNRKNYAPAFFTMALSASSGIP